MSLSIKNLLIILYLLTGYGMYIDRLQDIGLSFAGIAYVVLFLILSSTLVVASHIKNDVIRIVFALVLTVSAVFFDVYQDVTSYYLSYNAFISLFNSQAFIGDAIAQHFLPISIATAAGLLLFAGIALRPTRKIRLPQYVTVLLPVAVTLMFTVLLFVRGGDGAKALPSSFILVSYANLATYEALNKVVGVRNEVSMQRADEAVSYDIVYIVDESISANYLDINSRYGVLTNLKKDYRDFKVFNYGYAVSITNCSYDTNSTLRYGGTRKDYLKINSTMPSMWAYAKKSGMQTVYIDTQRTDNRFQNGMDEEELKHIDDFIQYNGIPVVDKDIAAAKTLAEYLNNDTREFIFINKTGAHFPVHDKYPDDFMIYKPALQRGKFLNISFTGSREGFDGRDEEWVKYRNSYKNTLTWSVGEFFATLFESASLSKAVIIYTSDHGQDLHERGNPGHNTHCGDHPNIEEGLVPIVVLEGAGLNALNWKKHFEDNRNSSSHYNIFPTLLSLMLYDNQEIKPIYGNSLEIETNDPFTFNIYFNARLGRKPIWKKIDLDKIVEPAAVE